MTPQCDLCGTRLSLRRYLRDLSRPETRDLHAQPISGEMHARPVRWLCGHCRQTNRSESRATRIPLQSFREPPPLLPGEPADAPGPSSPDPAPEGAPQIHEFPQAVDAGVEALLAMYDPDCGLTREEYLRRFLPGAILFAASEEKARRKRPPATPRRRRRTDP